MKQIEKDILINNLIQTKAYENKGLQGHIGNGCAFYEISIEDVESFNSLIWHCHRHTKLLTPGTLFGGKLYSLEDVTTRFFELSLSFKELYEGKIKGDYLPGWFQPCINLEKNFDYKKMNPLILTNTSNGVRRQCPNGTFQIVDGVHRSLVLSVLIKRKMIQFEPLKAILIFPKVTPLPWE